MIKLNSQEFLNWFFNTYPYINKLIAKSFREKDKYFYNKEDFKNFIKSFFPNEIFVKEQFELETGIWNFNLKNELNNLIYKDPMLIAIIGNYNEKREMFENEFYIYSQQS